MISMLLYLIMQRIGYSGARSGSRKLRTKGTTDSWSASEKIIDHSGFLYRGTDLWDIVWLYTNNNICGGGRLIWKMNRCAARSIIYGKMSMGDYSD